MLLAASGRCSPVVAVLKAVPTAMLQVHWRHVRNRLKLNLKLQYIIWNLAFTVNTFCIIINSVTLFILVIVKKSSPQNLSADCGITVGQQLSTDL